MSRLRKSLTAAIAASLLLGLSACGGVDLAGSAATVGQERITDETVTDQVNYVVNALEIEHSNALNRITIQRLINNDLIDRLAAENGIVITNGDVDSFLQQQAVRAGDQNQLAQILLEQFGIPSTDVQSWARFNLQVLALQEKLAPGIDPQQQKTAVGIAAIKMADQVGVSVNPRFGTWDARKLAVSPPPNDLSESPPSGMKQNPQLVTP